MQDKVLMESGIEPWESQNAINITFCVTEDCNLACKYCYQVNKNSNHRMDYETTTKIVDFVLGDEYLCKNEAVIWDFIGGEPLLEIKMIDKLCDYILIKMFMMNHKWLKKYRFSFTTNGLLYGREETQNYINKHRGHVWFSISLDGTKEKHDLARIKKDGSGSYDDVIKNIPLWIKQFPDAATKSTFAHADLPYLKDSIIHLWNLGINHVMANVVYEDVWEENDDIIYEEQLKALADYIIENKLWNKVETSFFHTNVGLPLNDSFLNKNRCTAGDKTVSFDSQGNIYPCIRFLELCFEDSLKYIVGNYQTGIDLDKLRAFRTMTWKNISNTECNNCSVGQDCGWCVANNYESSGGKTLYNRSIAICKMHKANARANHYFWKRYSEVVQKTSPLAVNKVMQNVNSLTYIQFILSDQMIPMCNYKNNKTTNNVMSKKLIYKGLKFAKERDLVPVYIGEKLPLIDKEKFSITISSADNVQNNQNYIKVYDENYIKGEVKEQFAILLISKAMLNRMSETVKSLFNEMMRINVFIKDLDEWSNDEFFIYEKELNLISTDIIEHAKMGKFVQMNVLTDQIYNGKTEDCGSGIKSIALAPNGKLYLCPAFYFEDEENYIGDIEDETLNISQSLLKRENSTTCSDCKMSCSQCVYLNKKVTNEYRVASYNQCRKGEVENRVVSLLEEELKELIK